MTPPEKLDWRLVVALFIVTTTFVVGASAQQVVNPDSTIVVANLNPVEGETVEIHNAANDASRCEGGVPWCSSGGFLRASSPNSWATRTWTATGPSTSRCRSKPTGPAITWVGPTCWKRLLLLTSLALPPGRAPSAVPEFALRAGPRHIERPGSRLRSSRRPCRKRVPVAAPVPAADTVVIAPTFTG